jgi:hypothetical protein
VRKQASIVEEKIQKNRIGASSSSGARACGVPCIKRPTQRRIAYPAAAGGAEVEATSQRKLAEVRGSQLKVLPCMC